jgi:hypothetical protein
MAGRDETVQIEGLSALVRALKQAEADLDDLKNANQAAGRIVLDAARPAAPHRTGTLAASGRANRAAKKANVLFGSARVPWANPIHWGWPAHHIAAQPFVTTAAAQTQPEWLGAYERDVQAVLNTVERAT